MLSSSPTSRRRLPAFAAALALILPSGCGTEERKAPSSGPYVQDTRPDSAVVAAVTRESGGLLLAYGPAGGGLDQTVKESEATRYHALRAENLQPATLYDYRLENTDGVVLGTGTFRTAPARATATCTFLALGDTGGTDEEVNEYVDEIRGELDDFRGRTDDENQQSVVAATMLNRRPDLIIHTGDLVYPDGSREKYEEAFFRPFGQVIRHVPIYPTLGNHDVKSEHGRPFLDTFHTPVNGPTTEGRIYSFNHGCVHFTCLDTVSTSFEAGSPQLTWLENDLQSAGDRWKVVYFHVPPYSPTRGDSEPIKQDIVPILEGAGVDLVLTGHDHAYARFFPTDRTTYIVTGGGGKSLYEVADKPNLAYAESVFHFVEGTATPTTLTIRAIDARGRVFDEVLLVR